MYFHANIFYLSKNNWIDVCPNQLSIWGTYINLNDILHYNNMRCLLWLVIIYDNYQSTWSYMRLRLGAPTPAHIDFCAGLAYHSRRWFDRYLRESQWCLCFNIFSPTFNIMLCWCWSCVIIYLKIYALSLSLNQQHP